MCGVGVRGSGFGSWGAFSRLQRGNTHVGGAHRRQHPNPHLGTQRAPAPFPFFGFFSVPFEAVPGVSRFSEARGSNSSQFSHESYVLARTASRDRM